MTTRFTAEHYRGFWLRTNEHDAMLEQAAAQAERLDRAEWTLDNIYTLARREANVHDPNRWGHILRLCEKFGCKPRGVLKDSAILDAADRETP